MLQGINWPPRSSDRRASSDSAGEREDQLIVLEGDIVFVKKTDSSATDADIEAGWIPDGARNHPVAVTGVDFAAGILRVMTITHFGGRTLAERYGHDTSPSQSYLKQHRLDRPEQHTGRYLSIGAAPHPLSGRPSLKLAAGRLVHANSSYLKISDQYLVHLADIVPICQSSIRLDAASLQTALEWYESYAGSAVVDDEDKAVDPWAALGHKRNASSCSMQSWLSSGSSSDSSSTSVTRRSSLFSPSSSSLSSLDSSGSGTVRSTVMKPAKAPLFLPPASPTLHRKANILALRSWR